MLFSTSANLATTYVCETGRYGKGNTAAGRDGRVEEAANIGLCDAEFPVGAGD